MSICWRAAIATTGSAQRQPSESPDGPGRLPHVVMLDWTRPYRGKATKRETAPTFPGSARVSLHSSPRRATMHYWTLVERDRAARGLCPAARSIDVRKAWEWGLSCSDWLPRAFHFLRGTRSTWDISQAQTIPSLTIGFEPREAFWFRYTIPICCSRRRARVMYGLMRSCEWISNKFDAWSWGRFSHPRRFVPQMLCWIGTRPHLRIKRGMLDSCLLPFRPSLLPAPVI